MDTRVNLTLLTGNASYGPMEYDQTNETVFGENGTIYIPEVNNLTFRFYRLLGRPHQLIALFLSLIAIILNILSLCALTQVKNRVNTHLKFIISLALSDIVIAASMMMFVMNKVWFRYYPPGDGPWIPRVKYRCFFVLVRCLNNIGLNSSLLNLMMMAVDHFVAIIKPLHYPAIMKHSKVNFSICTLWTVSIVAGLSDFLSGLDKDSTIYNYCEIVWMTRYNDEYLTFILAFACFVVMMIIYVKIYVKIQQRQSQTIGENVSQNSTPRNKRPLITTLLILGSFVLCWLPMFVFQMTLIAIAKISPESLRSIVVILSNADQYLYDLLLLNCISDAIIYATRMHEVKLGYRRLFLKCGLFCKQEHVRSSSSRYLFRSNISGERSAYLLTCNDRTEGVDYATKRNKSQGRSNDPETFNSRLSGRVSTTGNNKSQEAGSKSLRDSVKTILSQSKEEHELVKISNSFENTTNET